MLMNEELFWGIEDKENCFFWKPESDYIIGTHQNSWVLYMPKFLPLDIAKHYFDYLHPQKNNIEWQTENIKIFGKSILVPRLVAWYSDKAYGYSGVVHPPQQWNIKLLEIKKQIEEFTQKHFPLIPYNYNSVLLNFYSNGEQYMGYHQDNEKSLGNQPTIASLSLGATRKFTCKHIVRNQKVDFNLKHGSLIVFGGDFQTEFTHALPKQKKVNHARINLTFRKVVV
jgi:alkylated DNA repair dioxygenase AlkB